MKLSDISLRQEGLLTEMYAGKFVPGDQVFVLEPTNPHNHEAELDRVRRAVIVTGNTHASYPEYVRTGDEEQYRNLRATRNPVALFTLAEVGQIAREDPRIATMLGVGAFNLETFDNLRMADGSRELVVSALSDIVTRRCAVVEPM